MSQEPSKCTGTTLVRPESDFSLSAWQRDPYRLFFPLGLALAWGGVLHWMLYALGVLESYRSVFHSIAQIQGFMTCFAVGFLLTFIPRRTGTSPASSGQVAAAALSPALATAAAWAGHWTLSQAFWLVGAAAVIFFAARRLSVPGVKQRLPPVFFWVPLALLAGAGGAVMVAIVAAKGPQEAPEAWALGRALVLQGFVTGLVVGVGGTMLPTLTRGETPFAAAVSHGGRARVLNVAAAVLFFASFPLEAIGWPRLGYALRASMSWLALAIPARLWRPPSVPGLHRRLIWLSAWLVPAGYALVAAAPSLRAAALHVVFIGGFALMALSVSVHVALSHGGRPELLSQRPWQVGAMGVLLLSSVVFRLLAGLDALRLGPWLGMASAAFLAATICWAMLVLPALKSRAEAMVGSRPDGEPKQHTGASAADTVSGGLGRHPLGALTLGSPPPGSDVVALLLECHSRIRSFTALAARLASTSGLAPAEVAQAAASVHRYFTQALPLHARDEEESVLPRLRGRDPEVDRELAEMVREHQSHEKPVGTVVEICAVLAAEPARLRTLASTLEATTAALADHFEAHLEREEKTVFPAIRRLVEPDEQARMVVELRERRRGPAGG
jgi:uncharacterized protein involved in response to NO